LFHSIQDWLDIHQAVSTIFNLSTTFDQRNPCAAFFFMSLLPSSAPWAISVKMGVGLQPHCNRGGLTFAARTLPKGLPENSISSERI